MGDAESCLLRQQTREVRKKPLINYRFLRAAASAELQALAAAPLVCQLRAPRAASPETEPRREGARSADPAGQRPNRRAVSGEWNRAQPSAAATPGPEHQPFRRRLQNGSLTPCHGRQQDLEVGILREHKVSTMKSEH
ncbi:hypothetical protein MC885_008862 [Smutsia gigantea]|nr:hypothetical protein MC885_008862 [Smutsia gigantea]